MVMIFTNINSDLVPGPAPGSGPKQILAGAGGAAERRFFVFEVKGPPKYTEERVQELLRAPNYTTAVGSRMFLENDLVRMWDFHSPVGMDEFHQHVLDYAFVVIGNHSASISSSSSENIFTEENVIIIV